MSKPLAILLSVMAAVALWFVAGKPILDACSWRLSRHLSASGVLSVAQIITFTPAQPASRRAHLDATQAPDGVRTRLGRLYALAALALFVAALICAGGHP